MSNGVINTPSGAHEHQTNVAGGLVNKDKSTYTQQSVELYYERERLRKRKKTDDYNSAEEDYTVQNKSQYADNITEHNAAQAVQQQSDSQSNQTVEIAHQNSLNSSPEVAETIVSNSGRYSKYVKHTDITESTTKNKSVKLNTEPTDKFRTIAKSSAKAVSVGAAYLAESQSFQNDEGTGEVTAHKLENATGSAVTKVNKLANSRYFKFSGKASDSVKVAQNSGRFVAAAATVKKVGKKGVTVVDNALVNPIVKAAGDDVGSQTVVKMLETSRDVYKVGKTSVKYGYKMTKSMYRAGERVAKYGKKATQTTVKATTKIAETTAKVAVTTAKAVAATVAKVGAFIVANPIAFFIALIPLLVIMIILLFGSFIGGATEYASYEGAGNTATLSANNYSAVYDYTNKAIAQRCLDLFNLQDSWTGFLEYHYKYKIEKDDGTYIDSTDYPIADVAPIMAYLSVNYQSYTLTDNIKTEIDTIVNNLYTFDYQIDPCTHTVDHGSGNIEYIYGEKVTYTIIYHNAAKYFEENGYIAPEKMTAYNAVKSYGDIAYFRMYNLFGDKNWHDWISEQYGYSIVTNYNDSTEKYEYEMIESDYCTLEYRNKDNETAANLYSPLNGVVTSITETDDYDKVITIKDSENNLEFTIMADFDRYINLMINQGDNVAAGQQIATRAYRIYIKCKSGGDNISPMLIMEYFQHAD